MTLFTPARLAEILAVAEDAVSAFGGAQRGDKSLLDAIAHARDAAEAAAQGGANLEDALLASAAGARRGAAATATMEARVGRAARLGARSLGSIDAGAQSVAVVLTALSQVYAGASRKTENEKCRDDQVGMAKTKEAQACD
jgi:dihydroxyacetone kinase